MGAKASFLFSSIVLDILPALSSTHGDPMSSSNSASQILLEFKIEEIV